MAKDYAKLMFKPERTSKKRFRWHVIVVVFLILLMLGVGSAYYKDNKIPYNTMKEYIHVVMKQIVSWFHYFKGVTEGESSQKQERVSVFSKSHESDIQFDFYTTLPEMQVKYDESNSVEPAQKRPENLSENGMMTNKPSPATEEFMLQLDDCKDLISARELRLSLLLAGFEADIVKVSMDNNQTAYCIEQGPYASEARARAEQSRLQKKGFMSVIKKTGDTLL